MTEDKKPKLQKWAVDMLTQFIAVCPHIIKTDTKIEKFIEELNNAAFKINECTENIVEAINDLLPIISIYPNFFKPEIGIEAFTDELIIAASKYNLYFHKEKQ